MTGKQLLVFRHAKSSWKQSGLRDFDRPLNKRGKRDAKRMGAFIREHDYLPETIVSSPAVRAKETVELFVKASGFSGTIVFDQYLYLGEMGAYYRALTQIDEHVQRVMVVGHNPGLETFLETMTRREERLPTATIAVVYLPVQQWGEISKETRGSLVYLWRPREISA